MAYLFCFAVPCAITKCVSFLVCCPKLAPFSKVLVGPCALRDLDKVLVGPCALRP